MAREQSYVHGIEKSFEHVQGNSGSCGMMIILAISDPWGGSFRNSVFNNLAT